MSSVARCFSLVPSADFASKTYQQLAELARHFFAADTTLLLQAHPQSSELCPLHTAAELPDDAWLDRLLQQAEAEGTLLVADLAAQPAWQSSFTQEHRVTSLAVIPIRPHAESAVQHLLYLDARAGRQLRCSAHELAAFAAQVDAVGRNHGLLAHIDQLQAEREQHTAEMLRGLAEWVRQLTEADLVTLYPYVQWNKRFEDKPYLVGERYDDSAYRPGYFRADDIASLTAAQTEIVYAEDAATLFQRLGGDLTRRQGNFVQRERVLSTVAIPLRQVETRDAVGTLFLNYRQRQAFSPARRVQIEALAEFVAQVVVEARELSQEALRRSQELKKLREIDNLILQTVDLEELLTGILEHSKRHLSNAHDASLLLLDAESQELVTRAAHGVTAEARKGTRRPWQNGLMRGLIGWACAQRIPARVRDVRESPWAELYHPVATNTVSELDVPMLDGDEVLGALNFESHLPVAFSKEDQRFLELVAERIVRVLRNERQQEALREIEKEIVRELDLGKVIDTILDRALELTRSDYALMVLRDEQTGEIRTVSERVQGVARPFEPKVIAEGRGVMTKAFALKQPVLMRRGEPEWDALYIEMVERMDWQYTVPILIGDEVKGAVVIEGRAAQPLSERRQRLLAQLADHIAIALQNAERYKKAEDTRSQLEELHQIDQTIIEQTDKVDAVMSKIIQAALQLTGAEIGDIRLYEQEQTASASYFDHLDRYEARWWSEREDLGIIAEVARTRQPYLMRQREGDAHYKGDDQINSEVAVPLLAKRDGGGKELLGVLNVESRERGAFNEEHVDVLQLLAGQAVIAILNARHYAQAVQEKQRAEEEAGRFEVLLAVGKELGQVLDASEVDKAYQIIIDTAARFTDGLIAVRRLDELKQELRIVKQGGNTAVRLTERLWPTGRGLNWHVVRTRQTLWLSDLDQPPPQLPAPNERLPEVRSLVIVPIRLGQSDDEPIYGTIGLSHPQPARFKERDVRLIEGLAERLAIILHRMEAGEEKRAFAQRLREAEVMSSIGQAAAELGHRLGNDLSFVRPTLEEIRRVLLGAGHLSDEVARHLDKVQEKVVKTVEMNRQYKQAAVDIAHDQSVQTERQRVIVRELMDDIQALLPSPPANVTLHDAAIASDVSPISVVPDNIQHILYNLVRNAIEAMPDGGEIRITAANVGREVVIEVADTGTGMDEQTRARIFEPMFSTKGSTGFGLWSAKRYALANGGDLEVTSELGVGTTFYLKLPRPEAAST